MFYLSLSCSAICCCFFLASQRLFANCLILARRLLVSFFEVSHKDFSFLSFHVRPDDRDTFRNLTLRRSQIYDPLAGEVRWWRKGVRSASSRFSRPDKQRRHIEPYQPSFVMSVSQKEPTTK
jgi:hypothetical protein